MPQAGWSHGRRRSSTCGCRTRSSSLSRIISRASRAASEVDVEATASSEGIMAAAGVTEGDVVAVAREEAEAGVVEPEIERVVHAFDGNCGHGAI